MDVYCIVPANVKGNPFTGKNHFLVGISYNGCGFSCDTTNVGAAERVINRDAYLDDTENVWGYTYNQAVCELNNECLSKHGLI